MSSITNNINLENTNNTEKEMLYSLKGIFHSQLLSMEIIKHDTRQKMMHMLKNHPQGNPEWTAEQILKLADDNKIMWVKGISDPTEYETYQKGNNARLAEILRTVPDIDKAFGYMDTVTFREGDKKDVEYFVTGYEKDGRVNIESSKDSLSVFQEKLKLVKNGILFQKDDIIKFTEDAKYDTDILKPHYLPNTNHFSVMRVSRNDGSLEIGNPNNFKDDGTGKRVGQCIKIYASQLDQLELVTKKKQIRKMHGPEDTEITLFLPTSHRMHCTLDSLGGIPDEERKNFNPNSYTGSMITTGVKEQMIASNLAWIGYKNRAWYALKCIKVIYLCMKNTIPRTRHWKEKNARITRVVITDDLRFHGKSDTSAKWDWALVGNTQLHRNFIGLNRPLRPSNCESKKASTNSNLTDLPYELKISYDEEGKPEFNTGTREEKRSFMQMMYKAMGEVLQQEGLNPISQATPTSVIPENRVQTVEELPVATEVIPIE
jgi:hypothetical protein